MNRRKKIILVAVILPVLLAIAQGRFFSRPVPSGEYRAEVNAENFKFTPALIRVKTGTKVTLTVRALDDKHGIAFKLVAEGQAEGSPPGLRFATPTPDWILEKGRDNIIEFTAERPGTYEFSCSVFCGMGHNGMLGRVIVE